MDGYHDPAALQEGQDDEPQEPSQSPPIPQFSYEYQNQNQYQQRQSHPELLQRSHSEPQPNPSTLLHQPPYSQPEAEYQTYNLPEVHPDPRDTSPAPSHPQSRTEYQAYNFPEVHPDPRNASPAPRRQPGAEYQAYRPPPPPPESSATPSYLLPSTGNSSPAPDAALQQHYRSFSLPEVVPPQPPISNQPGPSTPFDGYEAPLERAATVGEMRRRDMKLRLAMMSRGSYG
ncbi:hypothetical protein N431DRAFT_432225 [Stipitochalara longipes BDJ]|nr:hypothetical protein N431DRAFT_432225 [Stipitochalara longipes BDJ]